MSDKISAVYQIINSVTGDRYVGSSRDVIHRWTCHKCPSTWKRHPNSLLYRDMQKYGVNKFRFQIFAPVEPEYLKQVEQEFIDMLNPTYNNNKAKCFVEENKEYQKEYRKSEKGKESRRKYDNQLCFYNGETLTLNALSSRFRRAGIPHPTLEAKKYLIKS